MNYGMYAALLAALAVLLLEHGHAGLAAWFLVGAVFYIVLGVVELL